MLRLKRTITVPPRHTVVVEVTCGNILTGQRVVVPDKPYPKNGKYVL